MSETSSTLAQEVEALRQRALKEVSDAAAEVQKVRSSIAAKEGALRDAVKNAAVVVSDRDTLASAAKVSRAKVDEWLGPKTPRRKRTPTATSATVSREDSSDA